MKRVHVLVIIVFTLSSCMNFNPTYNKLSDIDKKNYEPIVYNALDLKLFVQSSDTNISIYKLDISVLKELMKQSEEKYFLLVSYTFWCPSSKLVFDSIVNSTFKNTQLILFTPDDWYYIPNYKRFLKKKQYYTPTYILDIYKYGLGYNPHKRFDKFKKEISNDLEEIGGFPSYILIDKDLNLILKRTGGNFKKLLIEINNLAEK